MTVSAIGTFSLLAGCTPTESSSKQAWRPKCERAVIGSYEGITDYGHYSYLRLAPHGEGCIVLVDLWDRAVSASGIEWRLETEGSVSVRLLEASVGDGKPIPRIQHLYGGTSRGMKARISNDVCVAEFIAFDWQHHDGVEKCRYVRSSALSEIRSIAAKAPTATRPQGRQGGPQ